MKKLIYSLILAASTLTAFASQNSKQDFIHHEFDVNRNMTFEIVNQYGNITITNNNSDRLIIDATITITSRHDVDKKLNSININLSRKEQKIMAITDIDFKALKNDEFNIEYNISAPSYININISNKYGNVVAENLLGSTNIKVSYGMLKVNKIQDMSGGFPELTLKYSRNCTIDEMLVGGISISYSDININRAKALAISSKYSDLHINNTTSMAVESAYDKYTIGNVEKADFTSKFTNLNISTLSTSSDINMSYGNVDIENLGNNFDNINIKTSYANVGIGVKNLSKAYKIDLNTSYGNIKYPKMDQQSIYNNPNSERVEGQKGSADKMPQIKVSTKYGNIRLSD